MPRHEDEIKSDSGDLSSHEEWQCHPPVYIQCIDISDLLLLTKQKLERVIRHRHVSYASIPAFCILRSCVSLCHLVAHINILLPSSNIRCLLPLLLPDAMLERIPYPKVMGCTYSAYALGRKKSSSSIPEVAVFVPSIRIPVQSDLQRALRGRIPRELADKLSSLRNQIVLVAEDTGGAAIAELQRTLNEYLAVLIGLTKKECSLEGLIEFKWRKFEEGRQDSCIPSTWFEVISVVHLMAMLTLSEADSLMIPKDPSTSGIRVVSSENKREAVDLLLKASGYMEFCVRNVLSHMPHEVKKTLPHDLQDGVLEAISIQALGQFLLKSTKGVIKRRPLGTEIQFGLAVEDQKATLSVKRRLACEQVTYFSQAYHCLLGCDFEQGHRKKHIRFIKWKFLEAKAAAYYYHGLILDKGNEPSSHISAVSCFLASEELLAESKKACLSFCLADPVTRAPPTWGVMKCLHQKIPEVAASKSQMYGHLWGKEKGLQELPEFQLSLRPDDYELPQMDPARDTKNWETLGQPLKDYLNDGEDEIPTE